MASNPLNEPKDTVVVETDNTSDVAVASVSPCSLSVLAWSVIIAVINDLISKITYLDWKGDVSKSTTFRHSAELLEEHKVPTGQYRELFIRKLEIVVA